jgi:hypothetical protein
MGVDGLEIVHNETEKRFEVWLDGKLSTLDYMRVGLDLVITHVGVSPDLRGRGIAGKITEAALKYARVNLLRVIPLCPYAAAYIRKNPQYADLAK